MSSMFLEAISNVLCLIIQCYITQEVKFLFRFTKKGFFSLFFADRFGLETCFTSFQYWIRKEIFKKKKKVMGKLKVCFFCAFQQNVKITPGSYISKIYSSSAILRSICKVNIQQTYHSSKIFIQTTFRHSKSI